MSSIISIGTAVPEHRTKQSDILHFMQEAYENETASRKLSLLFAHSGIQYRYSVIPDFGMAKKDQPLFSDNHHVPMVKDRLDIFKMHAVPLALNAIQKAFEKLGTTIAEFGITHLITVTCTGMYAPGINAELIEQLSLADDIFHTSVNYLGCNAAFHALKIGNMIAQTDHNARVLIVCVELCTLHFLPKNNHDHLLSNTIFGDGAAAVIITHEIPESGPHHGLFLNGFYSLQLNKGKHLMGWNITSVNFEMVLDAKVPEFIGEEINTIVEKASHKFNIRPENINHWAIHPGGRKILDTIKKQMHLTDSDMQSSYKILEEYGNMSSPTILFVLQEIEKTMLKPKEKIFAVGFGPGLSIETCLLTYAE